MKTLQGLHGMAFCKWQSNKSEELLQLKKSCCNENSFLSEISFTSLKFHSKKP